MTAAVDQCRSIITNLSVHLSVYCERETLRWSGLMCVLIPHSGGSSVAPRLTDLVKLAQECCYHSNLAVAAHGIVVLANITVSCPENGELHWASGSPPLLQRAIVETHTTQQINHNFCNLKLISRVGSCPVGTTLLGNSHWFYHRFSSSDLLLCSVLLCVFLYKDVAQLEQEIVLAVESLLMLCSQDNGPGAQATLKVSPDKWDTVTTQMKLFGFNSTILEQILQLNLTSVFLLSCVAP